MDGSPLIGVITALDVEAVAVRHVLGLQPISGGRNDPNRYAGARLSCGPVVTTSLVETSNVPAAAASVHLVRSFPSVRVLVTCGIALGVPRPGDVERDVRLGDIVVGRSGVIHYGHRRITDEGVTLRSDPLRASPLLLRGVNEICQAQLRGERPWEQWLEPLPSLHYRRPEVVEDRGLRVFYGRIGSGDELYRSGSKRDEVAHAHNLLAMEMEGAGVAGSAALDGRECLVIRGVSDFGDKGKSDLWQPYASLAAAAYLRALLDVLGPLEPSPPAPGRVSVVELMERVPSLQSPGDRDVVLRLMGPPVERNVSRDSRTRMALISLAEVCGRHPGSFAKLIDALTALEGEDSIPVRELADAIAGLR